MYKSDRVDWIDYTKAIAITAVVIDHSAGWLYSNPVVSKMSFFSVSLFILLSGITSGIKYNKSIGHSDNFSLYIYSPIKRCIKLFSAYALACILIYITYSIKTSTPFRGLIFVKHLYLFDLQGPYYFFCFFLQLILIGPILNAINCWIANQKRGVLKNIFAAIGLLVFGIISECFPVFPNLYGGGKYLFGGTYLFLFYSGIMLYHYGAFDSFVISEKIRNTSFLIAGLSFFLFYLLLNQKEIPFYDFIEGINPPGVMLIIYATAILFFLCSIFKNIGCRGFFLKAIRFKGQNTLSILLYHCFLKQILGTFDVGLSSSIILRIVSFIILLYVPAIGISIYHKGVNWIKESIISRVVM